MLQNFRARKLDLKWNDLYYIHNVGPNGICKLRMIDGNLKKGWCTWTKFDPIMTGIIPIHQKIIKTSQFSKEMLQIGIETFSENFKDKLKQFVTCLVKREGRIRWITDYAYKCVVGENWSNKLEVICQYERKEINVYKTFDNSLILFIKNPPIYKELKRQY